MLTKDDLKGLLGHTFDLTDAQVETLLPLAKEREVANDEVLYNQGDKADHLYLLMTGKVILEADVAQDVSVSLNSVKPGYVFGWAAGIGASHELRARAVEISDVVAFESESLIRLMREDHDLGYRIMVALLRLLKNRLDTRTNQFLRILGRHPDLQLGG